MQESNENQLFFSIIIPVYNSEKYIEECVNSVLAQTYKNFEIILVCDCPTDNSLNVCKNLQHKHKEIIFIENKRNFGISKSRNIGLASAKGKWILFIDHDDYYNDNTFLAKLSNKCVNCDVVNFGSIHIKYADSTIEENNKYVADWLESYDYINDLNLFLRNNIKRLVYVWAKCYRKQFLQDNNILFEESCITSEDTRYLFRLLLNKPKFKTLNLCPYCYRKHDCSTMYNTDMENNISLAIEDILHELQTVNIDFTYMKVLCGCLLQIYISTLLAYVAWHNHPKMDIQYSALNNSKALFHYVYDRNTKFAVSLLKTFGLYRGAKILSRLINLYTKLKNDN